ncbi:MAG: hypothetical protein KGP13_03625 [Burkholderiales bacterium]|nr:hypothetical protein [Burkholderiales bacterium]
MFHKSDARTQGGNLPFDLTEKANLLLDEFIECTVLEVRSRKLRNAIVRSMLSCNLIVILDKATLWVAAQKQAGMPSTITFDFRQQQFPSDEIFTAAKWEFGYDDPFVIGFPVVLLDQSTAQRKLALEAIAKSHVESEFQRVNAEMNTIQINPIFGPAQYKIDRRLAFVLMPFTDLLTKIYQTLIKPTVENSQFGLVCKRADDIKSNQAIIQDIWKSICEARIVIADLTDLNANVMYELGIAHTLGKETILLYQRSEKEIKFPFDLSHIRRIEYENTVPGAQALEKELSLTLENVLDIQIKA